MEEAEKDDNKTKVAWAVPQLRRTVKEEQGGSVEDSEGVGKLYVKLLREEFAIKAAHVLHKRVYNQKGRGVPAG